MLKEVLKIAVLLLTGMMIYDINKAGGFVNSDIYKYLDANGFVEYGEMFMSEVKTFVNKGSKFSQGGAPVSLPNVSENLHAYKDLFYNMFLVCKNSIIAACENSSRSLNKNFPTAVDDVSVLISGALTSTKEGLVLISSHLQNFTLSAVNYANNLLSRSQ